MLQQSLLGETRLKSVLTYRLIRELRPDKGKSSCNNHQKKEIESYDGFGFVVRVTQEWQEFLLT
jgi:hypothetical protein